MPKKPKPDRDVVGPPAEGGHAEAKDDEAARKREAKAEKKREAKRLAKEKRAREEAERAAAPARPDRPAPRGPLLHNPRSRSPRPLKRQKSRRASARRRPRPNGSGPTRLHYHRRTRTAWLVGDTVLFEQIQPNVAYLIENVARKHLEGRAYDVKYHARWTDGITQDVLDQCRALSPNFKWMISCLIVQKKDRPPFSESDGGYYDQQKCTATRPAHPDALGTSKCLKLTARTHGTARGDRGVISSP